MNDVSKLYWQLPWAGPRIDGDRSGWAVMPDPALGNAMGVCVPVALEEGRIVLKPANPERPFPLEEARLGVWTTLARQPDTGGFHLCLLGYDQPEGGFGREYVVKCRTTVAYADLQAAVRELQRIRGDEVAQQLVRWPTYDCSTNAPVAAADAGAELSMALAFGCCQYPSGLMDGLLAEASYLKLAGCLDDGAGPPTHLLLLGDQVYVDATAGLLDPVRLDDRFRVPYEGWLRIDPLRRIMRRLPVFGMLDDHEIVDNWEPFRPGAAGSLHDRGVAAYWTFQRMRPPAPFGPMPALWYTVGGPGWSAFMANTRTAREWRTEARLDQAEILGAAQKQALQAWLLGQPPHHLKLIASPALVLPRLREHIDDPLSLDNWQGYPQSLHGLLAFLCENRIGNVCLLSGDAHLAVDARIAVWRPGGPRCRLRSLHAPALYAPLPFANERPDNLSVPRDRFQFDHGGRSYHCSIAGKVQLPHRDGSWLLQARRAAPARPGADSPWKIRARIV